MPTSTNSARSSAQVGTLAGFGQAPLGTGVRIAHLKPSARLPGLSIQVVIARHLAVWRNWAEGTEAPDVRPARAAASTTPSRAMTEADRGFEAFVREYQDMVFATAVRLLGNPVEAEDVAQTFVFMKSFERFGGSRPRPGRGRMAEDGGRRHVPRPFCIPIPRTLAVLQRAGGHGRRVSDAGHETTRRAWPPNRSPAIDVEQADQAGASRTGALRRLPMISVCRSCSFTSRTRATSRLPRRVGVSIGKVKTDIHRGREKLQIRIAGTPCIQMNRTTSIEH